MLQIARGIPSGGLKARRVSPWLRSRPDGFFLDLPATAIEKIGDATRALVLCCAVLILSFSHSHAEPVRRVLAIYENESTLFAAIEVAQGLSDSLHKRMPANLESYSEYLDTVRFPGVDRVNRLADAIAAKYKGVSFDVVMAIGPGAVQFLLDHRAQIGANVPMVFGAVTEDSMRDRKVPPDAKGVISHFDVRKTVDLATQLQPDAKKVVVITGSSAFDRSWEESARQALGDRYGGLEVNYLSGLSLDGFKKAAHDLPRQTLLLVLTVFQDADGRKFVPRDAAAEIAAASNAPVYTVYSSYMGAGMVGGYVGTFKAIGEEMGAIATRIIDGDTSGPQTTLVPDGPIVDWNVIKRLGIDHTLIPKGSQILNYSPSIWEKYHLEIIAALTVIVLQSATIAALIIQDRRKRRLQAELVLERLELAHLSRTTQLGELSGALAHELNQPLTSILANAQAGALLLENNPVDVAEIRDILGDIIEDDKRAATVIVQLRRLMLKGETHLDSIDLNEVVSTTLALARSELMARQTGVELQQEMPEVRVRANFPQLQQVILNLVLNAADAMSHLPASERQIEIETRTRENGTRELTVSDKGRGVSPELRSQVFKPFVSTKKKSLGLGLAICNTIAQAHGGTLKFDEGYSPGARVILVLPPA
ncbi:ABC transporter substrate binding protein [Phyllobacterium sp. UNC302MFCol5.2]|uniref:sensor histidine kinase n=1 Tax=Phyllobacterium sp. UNC302MFCol5.2 TaxID=1449065 RepID=UPI001FD8F943|nr:ABC transporter substrate binding protein [Phyllobacterium sp. UNC302MFCol5.2]